MTKTLTGTWLAEVQDDALWDCGPYYPSLDEGNGMLLDGEWADARWALLNHLSEELSDVAAQTCGPSEVVDPDGSFDQLETRLVRALKALRRATPDESWEFNMDGCRYRLFIAGSGELTEKARGADRGRESFNPDAFVSWVSPEIVRWGESKQGSRRRHLGGAR